LNGGDTYPTVIQALGVPDRERWVVTPSGNRVRLLDYRDRGFQAVLAPQTGGPDRYAGSVDERGHVLQSVSTPILRDLQE
jgi:hypothetical protein